MSDSMTIGAGFQGTRADPGTQPANPEGLAGLISPRRVDEFFDAFWPNKALYFSSDGDQGRLPECFRDGEHFEIGALAARARGGAWVSNAAKASHQMKIDRRAAEHAYKMGLTVYLDDVMAAIPGAAKFTGQLEADLGMPEGSIRLTAWASPVACGAAPHYDNDDVISIQIRGRKRFEICPVTELPHPVGRPYSGGSRLVDETFPQMVDGFPSIEAAEYQSIEMLPGSVLIFQRGTWHRTFADEDSLSLSFVMDTPTAADSLLRQLRDVLDQDPQWRRPLYGAWGDAPMRADATAQMAALLKDLPRKIAAIQPEHVIASRMTEQQRIAAIGPQSRFQRVPMAFVTEGAGNATHVDAHIHWRLEDRSIELQATMSVPKLGMEAIEWIAARDRPFAMSEIAEAFPKIPEKGLTALMASLADMGLVKLLWYPEAPRG